MIYPYIRFAVSAGLFNGGWRAAISRVLRTTALPFLLFSLFAYTTNAEELMEGARLTQLTTDGKSSLWDASWRGNRIVYRNQVSDTQRQLRIMNVDGSDDRDVSPIGNPFFAQWSWSDRWLVYEFSGQRQEDSPASVFIYDVENDRSIPVSSTYTYGSLGRSFRGRPVWSADDGYVAYSVSGSGGNDEVWVAETATGKYVRILSARGEVGEQKWSPGTPSKLVLLVQASGGRDVAVVNPDGTELTLLTNIGSDTVDNERLQWSHTGEWIGYISDLEMRTEERDRGRSDIWIARPDGSEVRNLTQASSNVTEDQRRFWYIMWSWDGRWISSPALRFDKQGRRIPCYFLLGLDGTYEMIRTSYPETTGEFEQGEWSAWSYDSKKIAFLFQRNRVRSWTSDPEFENTRTALTLYDVDTRTWHDVLVFNEEFDRKEMGGAIAWSPDSKSIFVTIENIISADEGITQPDIFRVDLPPELVSPEAVRHIGPPIGREIASAALSPSVSPPGAPPPPPSAVKEERLAAQPGPAPSIPTLAVQRAERADGGIIMIVEPQHMTVAALEPLIPDEYAQYLKRDTSRNLFVFVGPADVHRALLEDLKVIDFPAAHIVVDLLAVETSDEVNRKLGLDLAYTQGRFSFIQPEGLGVRDLTPGFSIVPPTGIGAVSDLFTADAGSAAGLASRFGVGALTDLALGGIGTFPNGGQSFYQGVGRLPREFFARLDNLARNGEATILANPRTVATSGKESVIQIRRTVNFFFTEGVNLQTGTPNVRKSDVTATTEGRITPTLLANGKIHMVVDVNVGTVTFGAEDLPEQTDRKAKTEVTVSPGETIVIGGLRQQEFKVTEIRMPILGFLPYIGKFFTKTSRETRHSVLTILITPYVMGEERAPLELPDPNWVELEMDRRYNMPIMENEGPRGSPKDPEHRKSKKKTERRRTGTRIKRPS